MFSTTIKPSERWRAKLIPGAKIGEANSLTLPNRYPSLVVYSWLVPGTQLDLKSYETANVEDREPVLGHPLLKPHQQEAFGFISKRDNVLLGDAPGVGKTLSVLASITTNALVIAPASLLHSAWLAQAKEFRPDLKVVVVDGSRKKREQILEEPADLYVMSYEAARTHTRLDRYGSVRLKDSEKLEGSLNRDWDMVVLDEGHRIKNPKSKTARACWRIAKTAAKRIVLTGTPVSNSPVDLWSIYRFLDPDLWTSRSAFIDLFLETRVLRFGSREVTEIGGVHPPMQSYFDKIINYYMMRRTLEDVGDPPEIIRQTRFCTLGVSQKRQYKELDSENILRHADDYVVLADPLVKSMRLHQLSQAPLMLTEDEEAEQGLAISMQAPSPKVSLLVDTLTDIDGPVVVFSHSKQLAYLAVDKVKDCRLVCGDTSKLETARHVEDFQAGKFKVLIATLGSLSEGVTLTAASTLIFLQRSFSLVQSVQAEARIRRITSKVESVRIIDLVCGDTLDELPAKAIAEKDSMFQKIIEDPRKILAYSRGVPPSSA